MSQRDLEVKWVRKETIEGSYLREGHRICSDCNTLTDDDSLDVCRCRPGGRGGFLMPEDNYSSYLCKDKNVRLRWIRIEAAPGIWQFEKADDSEVTYAYFSPDEYAPALVPMGSLPWCDPEDPSTDTFTQLTLT